MKVCPYCRGITEEPKAIKCAICGMDISKEVEYQKEELEDDLIKDEIENHIKRQKLKKVKKKIYIASAVTTLLVLIAITFILTRPKGYINIEEKTYNAKVGEQITVNLVYGGNIKDKDVELEIVSSEYDGKKISFRYKIEDSICYVTCFMKDNLTLRIYVKDNGEQYKYNNIIYISITE